MSDFQLKRKELVSQLSLTDVEFQAHIFETTKCIALRKLRLENQEISMPEADIAIKSF